MTDIPPDARTAAAVAASVHRWKSMGTASVECECGEVLYGPGNLTQFPADEAFRRHLADAMLAAAAPLIRADERERCAQLAERHAAVAERLMSEGVA